MEFLTRFGLEKSRLTVLVMIGAYVPLSPLGLVDSDREKTIEYGYIAFGLVVAFCVLGIPVIRKHRQAKGA